MHLKDVADDAAEEVRRLIMESEDAIVEDIKKTAEEAQTQGKEKYSFKLSHTIVLDLSGGSQKHSLTWNVSRRTDGEAIPMRLAGEAPSEDEVGDAGVS